MKYLSTPVHIAEDRTVHSYKMVKIVRRSHTARRSLFGPRTLDDIKDSLRFCENELKKDENTFTRKWRCESMIKNGSNDVYILHSRTNDCPEIIDYRSPKVSYIRNNTPLRIPPLWRDFQNKNELTDSQVLNTEELNCDDLDSLKSKEECDNSEEQNVNQNLNPSQTNIRQSLITG